MASQIFDINKPQIIGYVEYTTNISDRWIKLPVTRSFWTGTYHPADWAIINWLSNQHITNVDEVKFYYIS